MKRKSGPTPKPASERFLAKVFKQEDGCWWYGNRSDRYGMVKTDEGRTTGAHRFSYQFHKGEIPRGMVVRHKCDVRGCVNPEHLELGTHEDNTRDIVERDRTARLTGRVIKTRPVRARGRYGSALVHDEREKMRAEYATGEFTQVQLAKRYRVSQATVSATIRGVQNMGQGLKSKTRTGHFRRKLSHEDIAEIQSLYATGHHTQTALAARFHCHQTRISVIISRGK